MSKIFIFESSWKNYWIAYAIFYFILIHMGWYDTQTLWMFFVWLFVFFWIYTLLRVAKDISRRTTHLWTQVICIFVIVLLTPVIGLPVYFLLRPIPRKDILQEHQEITEFLHAQTVTCYACGWANIHEHMFCVFCGEKLKHACKNCNRWFAIGYLFCPYCATPSEQVDTHMDTDEWAIENHLF